MVLERRLDKCSSVRRTAVERAGLSAGLSAGRRSGYTESHRVTPNHTESLSSLCFSLLRPFCLWRRNEGFSVCLHLSHRSVPLSKLFPLPTLAIVLKNSEKRRLLLRLQIWPWISCLHRSVHTDLTTNSLGSTMLLSQLLSSRKFTFGRFVPLQRTSSS